MTSGHDIRARAHRVHGIIATASSASPPAVPPAPPLIPPLEDALLAHSPRFLPRVTPIASVLVHGAVAVVWLLLFAGAFALGGVYAWSTGIAYIAYDTLLLAFVGWQTWTLLAPATPEPIPTTRETLAVVVAAHDEAKVLPQTIAALLAQDDPPDAIVIADDGSSDGTGALLVERFGFVEPALGAWATSATVPSVHWLRMPHGGKARALNAALVSPIAACRTAVVMTVDADTHLAPGAIRAMRRAFSTEAALVAATGVLVPVCGPSLTGRLFEWFQTYEYIRNFLSRYAWMRIDSLLLISGAFAGFRREAVVTVGGFDPNCLVEDYELIHRLARHSALAGLGWRSRVIGGARAQTEAPSTTGAFLRQRRRWFGGFLQTQYWYRGMVGDGRRYGNVGRWMLPVKAVDTMQPVFGLTALGNPARVDRTGPRERAAAGIGLDRREDRDRPRLPPVVGPSLSPLGRRDHARRIRLRVAGGAGRTVQLPDPAAPGRHPRLGDVPHATAPVGQAGTARGHRQRPREGSLRPGDARRAAMPSFGRRFVAFVLGLGVVVMQVRLLARLRGLVGARRDRLAVVLLLLLDLLVVRDVAGIGHGRTRVVRKGRIIGARRMRRFGQRRLAGHATV